MADIYLSFDHPNTAFAQHLKHDIERFTGLSVAYLECDDEDNCEHAEDCHFLDQAKTLLMLATKHSNVTAWVMEDRSSCTCADRDQCSPRFPITIDFSENYGQGVNNLLCVVAKERENVDSQCTHEEERNDVSTGTPFFGSEREESSANLYDIVMHYFNPLDVVRAKDSRRKQITAKRTRRVLIV